MYRQSRQLEDWKRFQGIVKKTKQKFFNGKIDEITNKKCSLWELMNWVKKRSFLVSELRMMDLDFILFYFPFILSYIEKGQRRQKCDMVTDQVTKRRV